MLNVQAHGLWAGHGTRCLQVTGPTLPRNVHGNLLAATCAKPTVTLGRGAAHDLGACCTHSSFVPIQHLRPSQALARARVNPG